MTAMRWMRPLPRIIGLLLLLLCALRDFPLAWGAAPPAPGGSAPSVTLRKIHMIETRAGSVLWEVWADRAEVNEGEGYTVLLQVTQPVEVRLSSSQGQLTCTAKRARLDLTTKDVWLEGSVVARSDQGTELRTESLRWIAASRRFQTDQPVTLIRGSLVSRGRGLEAETDLERVRIFQNITSQLRPPGAAAAPEERSPRP